MPKRIASNKESTMNDKSEKYKGLQNRVVRAGLF
jgi:hypothetical protein